MVKFVDEVITTGHIKEKTFDETRDSALECAKQNIEASSLTEREKKAAKECVDKVVHDIAKKFKDEMVHSENFEMKDDVPADKHSPIRRKAIAILLRRQSSAVL